MTDGRPPAGEGSFGSGFVQLDEEANPEPWLEHLDAGAAIPIVRDAKLRLTDLLGLQPGERVLDVGCGTGVDSLVMAERVAPGGRLVAVDLSESAVAAAAARLEGVAGAEARVADAHALPFPDASFDACRVDRTMLHLTDPERGLREFRRVLAPGGCLGIQEFGRALAGDTAVLESPVHEAITTRYWHGEEKVAELPLFLPLMLARGGFEGIQIERMAAEETDFEAADTLMRLTAGAEEAVRAGAFPAEDASRWLAEVRTAMNAGEVRLVWQGMLFLARTPDVAPPSGH